MAASDHVTDILKSRASTHGDVGQMFGLSQMLKTLFRSPTPNKNVPAVVMEAVDMICMKLARVVVGNSTFFDHWADIAGYAELARQHVASQKSQARSVWSHESVSTAEAVLTASNDAITYVRPDWTSETECLNAVHEILESLVFAVFVSPHSLIPWVRIYSSANARMFCIEAANNEKQKGMAGSNSAGSMHVN